MNDTVSDISSAHSKVLIVGAGPVGLMSAILLARQGVASVVIERRVERSLAPKAHALNPRSLEICRAAGLELDALYARRTPPEESQAVRFVSRLSGEQLGWLPYERQDEDVRKLTPTPLINISQPDFEAALLSVIAAMPLVDLRYGVQWIGALQEGGRVTSTVRDRAGTLSHLCSDFAIACDGAASPVRNALGISMEGLAGVRYAINIHFAADLRRVVNDRPAILYWTLDPEATGIFIVYNLSSSIVFMYQYDPAVETLESFTPERCRALVSAAIGDPSVEIVINSSSPWVMTAQVATRYGDGRIFLAGDAAHRFPPTGGLGLNTGIADAHNLTWKIGAVCNGWAGAKLLDSYESERRPVAVANSDRSLVNAKLVAELFGLVGASPEPGGSERRFDKLLADPTVRLAIEENIAKHRPHFDSLDLQLGYVYGEEADAQRDVSTYTPAFRAGARMPHAWIYRSTEEMSTLDLLSPTGFTLIAGVRGDAWQSAVAAETIPIRVLRLNRDFTDPARNWTKQSGLDGSGALLVRPDGHIAWYAADDRNARRELNEAVARATGAPALNLKGRN